MRVAIPTCRGERVRDVAVGDGAARAVADPVELGGGVAGSARPPASRFPRSCSTKPRLTRHAPSSSALPTRPATSSPSASASRRLVEASEVIRDVADHPKGRRQAALIARAPRTGGAPRSRRAGRPRWRPGGSRPAQAAAGSPPVTASSAFCRTGRSSRPQSPRGRSPRRASVEPRSSHSGRRSASVDR